MGILQIVIFLITGIGVGFVSGLIGVGGGFIMTPVQYAVYLSLGIPADTAIKLAFGTSLLVILPTAISGTLRHNSKKAVWWKAALTMGCFSLLGGLTGSTIATHISGSILKIFFGIMVMISATLMLTSKTKESEEKPRENIWLWIACAFPVGIVTGFLGLGGGVLVIPVMTLLLRFKIHNAVGTSLAMMILTSIGSVVGYIVNGIGVPDLPPFSIGYVNLLVWILLSVPSFLMAQVGAIVSHRVPAKQLRYIFGALMFYIGLRMIGVFQWLGWPL
jgi:uncharacterized protein